ncbi:MAG TPA: hypothetical protein VID27_10790 [Blastocatellia bacterium]|jgi:hypothetical protein
MLDNVDRNQGWGCLFVIFVWILLSAIAAKYLDSWLLWLTVAFLGALIYLGYKFLYLWLFERDPETEQQIFQTLDIDYPDPVIQDSEQESQASDEKKSDM